MGVYKNIEMIDRRTIDFTIEEYLRLPYTASITKGEGEELNRKYKDLVTTEKQVAASESKGKEELIE